MDEEDDAPTLPGDTCVDVVVSDNEDGKDELGDKDEVAMRLGDGLMVGALVGVVGGPVVASEVVVIGFLLASQDSESDSESNSE